MCSYMEFQTEKKKSVVLVGCVLNFKSAVLGIMNGLNNFFYPWP